MKLFGKLSTTVLATSALAMAAPAMAQDNGWSGEASLSGSRTTGNTQTTDVGLALNLQKATDTWNHTFNANADFGRVSGETNKERYAIGYQLDRNLTDRLYAFGNGDYYRDEFGAFDEGYYLGAGLGYKLVLPAPLGWDVKAGVGYRFQTPRTPEVPGEISQADSRCVKADI